MAMEIAKVVDTAVVILMAIMIGPALGLDMAMATDSPITMALALPGAGDQMNQ